MNIMNQLTLRHLKQNKKRTMVTIIGVIISVAMITAVTTLVVSFMDLFQRQVIAREGEWHVQYNDVNIEQLTAIKDDKDTRTLILTTDRGYALLEGSRNSNKPYLFIKEYNKAGFKHFPIELSTGRLPQNRNEIVISEEIAENARVEYKIGEQITLDIGQRVIQGNESNLSGLDQYSSLQRKDGEISESLTKQETVTYTVVGTIKRPSWEPTWAPGYTVIGLVDESMLTADDKVDALVILKKVQRSLYGHAKELAEKNNIKSVEYNNSLLRYYGVTANDNLNKTLQRLAAIILTIIIIGSVSLIYNAFAISVSERSRHLGMLSSVGATKTQKRNSVFFEGMVIGVISIPIGIISGLAGLGITFFFINSIIQDALGISQKLIVTVTASSLLAACAVSVITIFISTYLPARRASRISAIDAIRQAADIKLTSKTIRTSKLIRKLFGIEAEIGLKNLKRNRRRYQATVLSIAISIVLFLTVSYFTDNLYKSMKLSQDGVNFDIRVNMSQGMETNEQIIEGITSRKEVTAHVVLRQITADTWLKEELVASELKSQFNNETGILKDGKYPYYLNIYSMDPESLKAYAQTAAADYDKLSDSQKPTGIVINTTTYQDVETRKIVETKSSEVKTGQSIDVFYRLPDETGEEEYIGEIEIIAMTDKVPMGVFQAGLGGLSIIVSEDTLEGLSPDKAGYDQTSLFLKSSDPMATQYAIEDIHGNDLFVYNVYQARQRDEQMILLMSVFTYGFIILITAICIANIFNTISTSIALRKREFAMLKSVGMTPEGFNKMINYESIFYGIKSLAYGLPLSVLVMVLIYRASMYTFSYGFDLPWFSILFAVASVFVIVGSAMLYSSAKVKKENIIDALKQENI